jgi:hypothetical protein
MGIYLNKEAALLWYFAGKRTRIYAEEGACRLKRNNPLPGQASVLDAPRLRDACSPSLIGQEVPLAAGVRSFRRVPLASI